MATYASRNVSVNGKLSHNGSAYSHEGNVNLIDQFGDLVMHDLGLAYLPSGEIDIKLSSIPHHECKNIKKIKDCAHLKELDQSYGKLIEILKKQTVNGYGPASFTMNTLIQIESNWQTAKVECRSKAVYVENGKEKLLVDPSNKFSFTVHGEISMEDTSGYHISSVQIPGKDKIEKTIKLFPYNIMRSEVNKLAGNSDEYRLILDPHLYGIMAVWALDRVTGFSEKGKKHFENVIKRLMETDEVIANMMDGCTALSAKKDKLFTS